MLQIKDIVTLLNPLFGFASIILSIQGDTAWAAALISIAYFIDLIDGSIVRLLGTANRFGAALDDACDTFSFGIAPAIFVYAVFKEYNFWLGCGLGFWLILCGIIRTARSNLAQTSYKGYFLGLIRPVSAMLIASMVSMTVFQRYGLFVPGAVFVVLVGLMSLTRIPYINHRQTIPKRRRVLAYCAIALVLIPALVLGRPGEGSFVIFFIYTIHPFFIITTEERREIRRYIDRLAEGT